MSNGSTAEQPPTASKEPPAKWSLENWKIFKGTIMTVIAINILAISIGFFAGYAIKQPWPIAAAIGSVGVLTFFGTMTALNRISEDARLSKGEMRKSIATSSFLVFFLLLAASATGLVDLSSEIMSNFTNLIIAIVVFYFSSRALEVWRQEKKS